MGIKAKIYITPTYHPALTNRGGMSFGKPNRNNY
jgi:hypothetical protein